MSLPIAFNLITVCLPYRCLNHRPSPPGESTGRMEGGITGQDNRAEAIEKCAASIFTEISPSSTSTLKLAVNSGTDNNKGTPSTSTPILNLPTEIICMTAAHLRHHEVALLAASHPQLRHILGDQVFTDLGCSTDTTIAADFNPRQTAMNLIAAVVEPFMLFGDPHPRYCICFLCYTSKKSGLRGSGNRRHRSCSENLSAWLELMMGDEEDEMSCFLSLLARDV